MDDVATKIIDILKKHMKEPRDDIGLNTALTDLKIESLDLAMIVFDIEDTFGIEIPYNANEEAADFKTVGSVVDRVRALIGTFAQANQLRFHDADGAGYILLSDEVVALDPLNPKTAARLVQPLGSWRRHDPVRQVLMRRELERVLTVPDLSKNTYEMVSKSLA